MLYATRFFVSVVILLWGLTMIALGVANGVPLWSLLGLVVFGVGTPLLASHPWAANLLYPRKPGPDRG